MPRNSESGNAFFIVMLGVVLFGALMFTFTRGARQGGENLTSKQTDLAAADMINYAQKVDRAIQRIYRRGISENAISFENNFISGYENANCTTNRCRIYRPDGGGISYMDIAEKLEIGTSFVSGQNAVTGVGQDCTNASCTDLTFIAGMGDTVELCSKINEMLEVTDANVAPPTDSNIDTTNWYQGSFAYDGSEVIGNEDATLAGQKTACFEETSSGDYYFYHVLLER